MTREEAIDLLSEITMYCDFTDQYGDYINDEPYIAAVDMAIKALQQEPCDKSAMMYEIYMEGVNMSGEYQGCWVRFKDIEKIVDKYMAEGSDSE